MRFQDDRREKPFTGPGELKILDVCSGSGCITLLLHSLLSRHEQFSHLKILGLDISEDAVSLAEENLQRNVKNGRLSEAASHKYEYWKKLLKKKKFMAKKMKDPQVQFLVHDILMRGLPRCFGHFDIIISNPPYISHEAFKTETTRSVRNWEPKIALVPFARQIDWLENRLKSVNESDIFYYQLLRIYNWNRSKVLLMEVGDQNKQIGW